eukprot:8032926-Alexandrium_andersonii.AAC.1
MTHRERVAGGAPARHRPEQSAGHARKPKRNQIKPQSPRRFAVSAELNLSHNFNGGVCVCACACCSSVSFTECAEKRTVHNRKCAFAHTSRRGSFGPPG